MSALARVRLLLFCKRTRKFIRIGVNKSNFFKKMGNFIVRTYETAVYPELNPVPYAPPTFEPELGLGPRKERVMIATEAELIASKVPRSKWDFCAHKYLEVERCKMDNFPFVWRCRQQSHETSKCYLDDYILRMKEYERERRLLHRQKKLEERKAAAA